MVLEKLPSSWARELFFFPGAQWHSD